MYYNCTRETYKSLNPPLLNPPLWTPDSHYLPNRGGKNPHRPKQLVSKSFGRVWCSYSFGWKFELVRKTGFRTVDVYVDVSQPTDATCLQRPHLFYACFVVSRITLIWCGVRPLLKKTCARQVVLDKWSPLRGRKVPLRRSALSLCPCGGPGGHSPD